MSRAPKAAIEPDEVELAGTVIAEGVVPGRPVPWKAPTIGRKGGCIPSRGYKRYRAWQETVHLFAATGRKGRRRWPYGGPVALHFCFYLRPYRTNPDATNLAKAAEDAIQGVLIVNDSQVDVIRSARVISTTEAERFEYTVIALQQGTRRDVPGGSR